jgi:hypothetical protein
MTTTLDLGRVKDWADEDRLQLPFRVWTSRYGNKLLAQRTSLAKVGITLGEPKFPLGYEKQQLRELAPTPQQFHLADEKFPKSGPKKQKRLPPTLDELKASGQVTISSQKHRAELEKLARWMGR